MPNIIRIWVAPEFRRKLKLEAARQDITLVALTKKLSRDIKKEVIPQKNAKIFDFKI